MSRSALPIARDPRVDAVSAELAVATTPAAVNTARVKAEALRDMLARALDLAGEDASQLVLVKRDAEEVALNAALKLGALVPAPSAGGRPSGDAGKLTTVVSLAREVGVAPSTLRNMRDLHTACESRGEDFAQIVASALDAGRPIPMNKLRALAKGPAEPQPTLSALAEAANALYRARAAFARLETDEEAPDDDRRVAGATFKALRKLCEQVTFALNGKA